MPELPEVETVVRNLGKYLPRQEIVEIKKLDPRSLLTSNKLILKKCKGLKILGLRRRGKGIIIDLSEGISFLIHLKMTGQLIYVDKSQRINLGHPTTDFTSNMPSKHTRVILKLSKGILYFNDLRRFGWIKIMKTNDINSDSFIKKLGIEPFDKNFNTAYLWNIIKKRPKTNIKATILDQSVVTGVGNIYASEALFLAKIRPNKKNKEITRKEIEGLVTAIKNTLKKGIKYSGTSVSDYKTPEGSLGKMQNHLLAYYRDNLPCTVCKTTMKKIQLNGRGTYFCPNCQK